MEVVVQRVSTLWTKQSRGGPAAAVRNATPIAFPLPSDLTLGVHAIVMRERDAFRPQMSQADLAQAGMPLRVVDGLLRVSPPETSFFGMPRRTRRPPTVRLTPGHWVRWQINYRHVASSSGQWYYSLHTFNIHFGTPTSHDVFLGEPARSVDERGFLR
jgi:hypothetical protein